MDRGAWRGYSPRGRRESDKTEATQHPAKPGPGAKGPRCSCGWRLSPERSLPAADLGASCLERVRTDGGLHLPIPVFGGQTLRDSDASLRGKDQGVSDSVRLLGLRSARLLCPWDSPGKDTGVGCHFLLLGIFQTQGSNPRLLQRQAGSLPLRPAGKPQERPPCALESLTPTLLRCAGPGWTLVSADCGVQGRGEHA